MKLKNLQKSAYLMIALAAGFVGSILHDLFLSPPMTHKGHFEIVGDKQVSRPTLDVLSWSGVEAGRKIAGVVVHNYSFGPGIQVDQVGPSTALILKQARNGIRMPESNDLVD